MTAPENAAEIQAEIERTRERLGQTVEELAAKADVKGRARDKAEEMKAMARDKAAEMKARATEMPAQLKRHQMVQRNWPLALAAAGILLMGSALVRRRWKT